MKKYFFCCAFVVLLIAAFNNCNQKQKQLSFPYKNILGIWIPKNINWHLENTNVPDITPSKQASCIFFRFISNSQYNTIHSTLTLTNQDSISTQTDLFCQKSDFIFKSDNDSPLIYNSKDSLFLRISNDSVLGLTYKGIEYIKANNFDKWSNEQLENCPLSSNP